MAYSAAIVGAGLMGRWHAHAARKAGIDIIAVVDPDPMKCHEVAIVAKATYECRDLSDMFNSCTVDAVHICTPLSTHYELCRQALEGGANVLCEKPRTAAPFSTAINSASVFLPALLVKVLASAPTSRRQ